MDDPRYSIGELSRRTGLTVKAIRFYSDRGIVAPSGRTASGHRRYDVDALARLELVRTLRELGLDLATIRKVAESEAALPDVAEAHMRALEAQIHVLRLRHAVLKAVTRRGATPEEITLMHDLAKLTEEERRRLIGDFLDAVFGGLEHPGFAGIARTLTPELPESPAAEQVDAWVELAELARDPDFRALMRRLAEGYEAAPRRDLPWLDSADDPRRVRYLELLAVINGWAAPDQRRVR
ncbi:MerR family transcriptional regulator [Amycolatopsis sp. NPDC058340]|uniref:MerR family transcriptional regulator n=1 Tax=Amycolatopsis sp. NPDC058340 TaxID=3346453 RepID=UPI003646141A